MAKTVLNRTHLVDATITTVAKNLAEGAMLVILVLFLLLGNFRAALITALVIPVTMLLTATGMVQGRISANLMSLGALDFGLIVDGAVIIAENSLRRLAERQHAAGRTLRSGERLETVFARPKEMIQPTVYGQAIIILVYVPLLTFTGVEGKMFQPMAMTVIIALVGRIRPLAHLRAGDDRDPGHRHGAGRREHRHPRPEARLWARSSVQRSAGPRYISRRRVLFAAAALLFARLARNSFRRSMKRHRHACDAHSEHLAYAVAGDAVPDREAVSAFPEVAYVFSKTGTAEMATDPMPPNVSDTFIILKPRSNGRPRPSPRRS